ncbi:MAG TPA: prephenate dehydratase [Blastocatellia bacterium]|nr:prephenate dehydratase [Blastocatellia bacterium]
MVDENDSGPVTVAFQGEPGAFSQDAARKLLGPRATTLPCRKFDEMFEAVTSGRADTAIAPIENSLAGSVHQNYDLMMDHQLTIVGEIYLKIVLNLIASPGATLESVRNVSSHPVALAQCERFFRTHPTMESKPAYDTAGSVKMVLESGSLDWAAIAGRPAATVYGGRILAESIQDNDANFTRFLLLARAGHPVPLPVSPGTARKTSIVFRVANRPSALFRALAVFALRDIDLTKIESRPIEGRPWEYSFYLDLGGDAADPKVSRAIDHLSETAESVRVLGSYPSGGSWE